MSDSIAWAAGLFEGEGNMRVTRKDGRLHLKMTDRDVVERFSRIVGVGQLGKPREYPEHPHWKTAFTWDCGNNAGVAQVLGAFLPYLGARRRARAETLLAHLASRPLLRALRARELRFEGVGGGC